MLDMKYLIHLTGAEADHLAVDQHCFGLAVMKATVNIDKPCNSTWVTK